MNTGQMAQIQQEPNHTFKSSPLELFTNRDGVADIDKFNPKEKIATIFYIRKEALFQVKKPYFMNIPVDQMPRLKQTNICYARHRVAITDIRGQESLFSLDNSGFAISKLETDLSYNNFGDGTTITKIYYAEIQEFLKRETGAEFVLPFDYQVRRRNISLPSNSRGAPGNAQPFAVVHADQTVRSGLRRLKHFHPLEAKKYKGKQIQIVNVWRPLRGPIFDAPLAICDYRSVKYSDRVPTDIIFPDYLGETYHIYPDPHHRWYFIDAQESNEA